MEEAELYTTQKSDIYFWTEFVNSTEKAIQVRLETKKKKTIHVYSFVDIRNNSKRLWLQRQ